MFTLITFVILFIVSFVVAYIGWKSYSDSQQQVAELQNQLRDAQAAASRMQQDSESYRQWMGVGQFDNLEDVKKTFEADMERFGSNFDESRRSYREILDYLSREKDAIAAREEAATARLREVSDRLVAVENEKEKQVAQFQEQMKASEEEAARQRNQYARDRADLEKTRQQLLEQVDSMRASHEAELAKRDATIRDLNEKLAKSERAKTNLLAEVSKSAESFEVPDGRISWVNQDGTVWINLGAADSLRRQITFSVFDADARDPARSDQKGSIEVTRILGDHLAEARITSDNPRNPILSGDNIFSQVWHRGKKLRFALTGIIDLDGDGRSDMKLARELVELNGGVVDAYLDDDGKVVGEMSVNTRYLVLGDFPEQGYQAALQRGFQQMSDDAKLNGVEVITLDKFLNQVGYAPTDRIVPLDASARAADFAGPNPPSHPTDPRGNAELFRPRAPLTNPELLRPSTPAPQDLPATTPY